MLLGSVCANGGPDDGTLSPTWKYKRKTLSLICLYMNIYVEIFYSKFVQVLPKMISFSSYLILKKR